MLKRYWYLKLAPFGELYIEWGGSHVGHWPWFQAERDGGDLHVWIGRLKIEASKPMTTKGHQHDGYSHHQQRKEARDGPR
jgi:hypothetical protein